MSVIPFPVQPRRVRGPAVIDQDGGRVFVNGRLWKAFVSESNAARVAAALSDLASLDALSPQDSQ